MKISKKTKEEVLKMKKETNLGQRAIAKVCGISQSSVRKIILENKNEFEEEEKILENIFKGEIKPDKPEKELEEYKKMCKEKTELLEKKHYEIEELKKELSGVIKSNEGVLETVKENNDLKRENGKLKALLLEYLK